MRIALDYDGTYTEDTELWNFFIRKAQDNGHTVTIVTFRSPDQRHIVMDYLEETLSVKTLFTSGNAKREYALSKGFNFDVWIDDQPELIVNGSDWSQVRMTSNGQLGGQSG